MRFEKKKDLDREKQAIQTFVNRFKGTFKKLGPNDVDYRVYDTKGELIAYVEVKGRNKKCSEAYPLPVAARKIVKLFDKRLNPTIIWACLDGIIYGKVLDISGTTRLGGRPPRVGAVNDQEIMMYYSDPKQFRYIKF